MLHLILVTFILSYLTSHLSFILSYLLILDYLTLTLNKSYNILEKNQDVTTKFLYFVQATGAKSCVALFV